MFNDIVLLYFEHMNKKVFDCLISYPLNTLMVRFHENDFRIAQAIPVYRLAMTVCPSTFWLKFLVEAKSQQ